ncbi:hypothetical protein CCP2SC5_360001 [Azospirillaceae bacterium]
MSSQISPENRSDVMRSERSIVYSDEVCDESKPWWKGHVGFGARFTMPNGTIVQPVDRAMYERALKVAGQLIPNLKWD